MPPLQPREKGKVEDALEQGRRGFSAATKREGHVSGDTTGKVKTGKTTAGDDEKGICTWQTVPS